MNDKQRVAQHAVKLVKDGMVIGLGTGSTADCFIEALAVRVRDENLNITTVASSLVSSLKAQQQGLLLMAIEHVTELDLYVDGADEVAPDNTLLKGQGSDLVKEKLLARASNQFIVLVDQSKMVDNIGDKFSIPVEVMPFAWQLVKQQLQKHGGRAELRKNGNGLAVTSYGSLVLDVVFESGMNHAQLDGLLNGISGIVEHGVFYQLADQVLWVVDGQVDERLSF